MIHNFDSEIAERFGLLEAILLNNIYYWVDKNRANESNFYDGTYWTYNSTRAFNELFPYVSERQIKNALKHLREEGILLTGNYNKSTYDRTLWYALSKKGLSIVQKCPMEETDSDNGSCDNVPPIPDNKPSSKPSSKPDNNSCPEVKTSEPEAEVVITLQLNTGEEHPITEKDVGIWSNLYPAVDIVQGLRAMKGWLLANPKNRKTKSGIMRFVNGWLAKEQNKGGNRRGSEEVRSGTAHQDRISELVREDISAPPGSGRPEVKY